MKKGCWQVDKRKTDIANNTMWRQSDTTGGTITANHDMDAPIRLDHNTGRINNDVGRPNESRLGMKHQRCIDGKASGDGDDVRAARFQTDGISSTYSSVGQKSGIGMISMVLW